MSRRDLEAFVDRIIGWVIVVAVVGAIVMLALAAGSCAREPGVLEPVDLPQSREQCAAQPELDWC